MKIKVLDCAQNVKKGTGEISYSLIGLGDFSNFGKLQPASCEIRLTSEQFEQYKNQVNKYIELDLIFPKPTFPLTIAVTVPTVQKT